MRWPHRYWDWGAVTPPQLVITDTRQPARRRRGLAAEDLIEARCERCAAFWTVDRHRDTVALCATCEAFVIPVVWPGDDMGATHEDAFAWRDKIREFYRNVRRRTLRATPVLLLHRDHPGTTGTARIVK